VAYSLIEAIIPRLKPLFAQNKNELSRVLFYDVMQLVFLTVGDYSHYAKSSLIKGLSDPSREIRDNMVAFWNDTGRLSEEPSTRLDLLMSDLYD
jgi:hypothetical protein